MKTILAVLLVSVTTLSSVAQIAHWKVIPTFDDITLLSNGLAKVRVGQKFGLYNSTGDNILKIAYDSIGKFSDNKALIFNKSKFSGFVNTNGKLTDMTKVGYTLISNKEFFSEGFLAVKKNDKYYFINESGAEVAGPLADINPYYDGYAAIRCYEDLLKKTDATYLSYMNSDQTLVRIPEFEKQEDLSFISSFRDGKAVCIYKKKAYLLTDALTATPISTDTAVSKKSIISFENKTITPKATNEGYSITAKNAVLSFNKHFQLERIENGDRVLYSYKAPARPERQIKSEFHAFGEEGNWGLSYNGAVILPEQFSEIKPIEGKFAYVKLNTKWGLLTIDPNNQFVFKLNNNEHIGFNHRFYTAKLTTLMPSYIKCNNTTIFSKSADCEIQVESRTEIENIERNTLTYNCRLSIPSTLSDTLVTQEYRYTLKYDGLQSIDYKVSIPEWYVKYYEVKLSSTKFTVNATDTITVEFDLVKTDVARNDDANYFKTVELITPDNEDIPLNKITENHFSFRVGNRNRERLSFIVKITEIGCPSIEYPFEMVFEKPASKSKNKSVNVTVNAVRKRNPQTAVPVQPKIFIPE